MLIWKFIDDRNEEFKKHINFVKNIKPKKIINMIKYIKKRIKKKII